MRTFFVLISLVCCLGGSAQQISLMDSLRDAFTHDPKITGKLDGRISLINGNRVGFQGIKAGLAFGRHVELGLSYNWLSSETTSPKYADSTHFILFHYVAPYLQYRYVYKRKWRISIPVLFGIGRSHLVEAPGGRGAKRKDYGMVLLYEPSMHIDYLFLRYFNVCMGLGYRIMLINIPSIPSRFTAPTLAFHFGIDLGRMWADYQRLR